jgi:sulfur relay (sulfurtransferase) DsrC/TusE family protein
MLKRTSDDLSSPNAKKQRCGDKLDSMKATLEKMMQQATEEHEQARIAAIDHAAELEEKWQSARGKRDIDAKELESLTNEHETACQYFEKFETSSALKMLNKASNCELDSIQPLSKHREQIEKTLDQLKTLRDDLETQKNTMVKQLEFSEKEDKETYEKFKQAETNVEVITDLN